MVVALCCLVFVCLALLLGNLLVIAYHFRVVGELLDRIVILQGMPAVGRKIPELTQEEKEPKEHANPRDKYIKDRVRFHAGV